jgi:hypothetical protein
MADQKLDEILHINVTIDTLGQLHRHRLFDSPVEKVGRAHDRYEGCELQHEKAEVPHDNRTPELLSISCTALTIFVAAGSSDLSSATI